MVVGGESAADSVYYKLTRPCHSIACRVLVGTEVMDRTT
jgi:hypothetical protein